jgi:hypothetical protein
MSAQAWITLVASLLTVVVLAAFLIQVALVLWRVERRLRAVLSAVEGINQRAAPAGPVVLEINRALEGVLRGLQGVLTKKRPKKWVP